MISSLGRPTSQLNLFFYYVVVCYPPKHSLCYHLPNIPHLQNRYCCTPRPAKRLGLDSDLQIVCEASEVAQAVLNQQAVTFLNRYSHLLDSLHVSNEYTGYLPDVDDSTEVVVIRKPQNRLEMTFKCELSWTSVSAAHASSFDHSLSLPHSG